MYWLLLLPDIYCRQESFLDLQKNIFRKGADSLRKLGAVKGGYLMTKGDAVAGKACSPRGQRNNGGPPSSLGRGS